MSPQTNEPIRMASKIGVDPNGADRAASEAEAQSEKIARDTEKVIEKTAEASGDAARANQELLRRNAETAVLAV